MKNDPLGNIIDRRFSEMMDLIMSDDGMMLIAGMRMREHSVYLNVRCRNSVSSAFILHFASMGEGSR